MIKIYGMNTCPYCIAVKEQMVGREGEFEYIDIGSHVKLLKEFLRIRDNNPIFDEIKVQGKAGIPCFVREDGTVSLELEDFGFVEPVEPVQACSIQDHREGKEGC